MKNFILKFLGLFLVLITMGSCVKDTDFDQFDQTLLEPVIDLNLVFWDLEAPAFNNTSGNLPLGTVRDTTEIRFLDDPDTQDSVVRAEFLFEFENSSDSGYEVVIDFVSLSGDVTYSLQTVINAGSLSSPLEQVLLRDITAPEVSDITRAGLIAMSAVVQGLPPSQGSLNMKSKARFYLEISGQ